MKHIQFLAGLLPAAAMYILLVYEDKQFLRWIAAGVGLAALVLMFVTFLMAANSKRKKENIQGPADRSVQQ